MIADNIYIFDFEVSKYDWLFVGKELETGEYTIIHNNNPAMRLFMECDPLLGGFNNKHYDNFILRGILNNLPPEYIKAINDAIIVHGIRGWDIEQLRGSQRFESFDLMDDCQKGLGLKAIEAHLGIDIEETSVDFNLDREWTDEELQLMIKYCKWDVDSTEKLFWLRQKYLENKIHLGAKVGLTPAESLYMTNAKLTAAYLQAKKPVEPRTDEREYRYPDKLKREYIPMVVFEFFDRIADTTIPAEDVFHSKLNIMIGDCPCTIAYGGIHGAIPNYLWEQDT